MRSPDPAIGTRRESSLHRALKFRYSGQNGHIEQVCGEYVCDCVTERGEIVEIQTGSFGPLREKVKNLLIRHPVRIVHPVIVTAYIETYNTEAILLRKRKSPRRGSPWDLFKSLLYAPELPLLKGLSVELALIDVLERRVQDGKGSWRRGGTSITGRELTGWHESIVLKKPGDYRRFIPIARNRDVTVCSLAETAGISGALARKTLYVLAKMGVVERTGKLGRFYSYRAVEAARIPKPQSHALNSARKTENRRMKRV
ncbi:MAG: hypothetical protein LBD96_01755 [Treponema sp.]|jgi:hypothetical protein|nr:hypothetical protein [Treponema sp.]